MMESRLIRSRKHAVNRGLGPGGGGGGGGILGYISYGEVRMRPNFETQKKSRHAKENPKKGPAAKKVTQKKSKFFEHQKQ